MTKNSNDDSKNKGRTQRRLPIKQRYKIFFFRYIIQTAPFQSWLIGGAL